MYQSGNPDTGFVPALMLLMDIYASCLFFWSLIHSNSFTLCWVDRVTTGTCWISSYKIYWIRFIKFISQLIRGISRAHQKLIKYINDITISTSLALPATENLLFILALNVNDSEFVMLSLGSSLQYYHRLPDVFA